MTDPSNVTTLLVRADDRADLEAKLNLAEARLQAIALAFRDRGIMVTRHSAWDFTVELHPDVPYGQTHETQLW